MPEISREPPAYEQIAEHYRAAIRSGQLSPGDELLSVRALKVAWGVTLKVAHRALAVLRDEGWIESRPGRPAIAKGPPVQRNSDLDDGNERH